MLDCMSNGSHKDKGVSLLIVGVLLTVRLPVAVLLLVALHVDVGVLESVLVGGDVRDILRVLVGVRLAVLVGEDVLDEGRHSGPNGVPLRVGLALRLGLGLAVRLADKLGVDVGVAVEEPEDDCVLDDRRATQLRMMACAHARRTWCVVTCMSRT